MHGLIFATWEKYLSERFGSLLLRSYRTALGETPATTPLVTRVYEDDALLAGVDLASVLVGLSTEQLLREYGRYFIINGLTQHLCAYLLTKVYTARDLLLVMRQAHAQMHRLPEALVPPIFRYEPVSSNFNALILLYESKRQLCPVLWGAIEGAADRFGERAEIFESTCMNRGDHVCRFEIRFLPSTAAVPQEQETYAQLERRQAQQQLAQQVLRLLPSRNGLSLIDVQARLQHVHTAPQQLRPSVVLEALHHLQHAGLVASTANQPGDNLTCRRYWRAPTR